MLTTVTIFPFRVVKEYPYQVIVARMEDSRTPLVVILDHFRKTNSGLMYYHVQTYFCENVEESEKRYAELLRIMYRMVSKKR